MKLSRFTLRGFKRPHEALASALGSLEREVMNELWQRGETSVREVHQFLGERMAYTTLMTTFDRLYKKGLLVRRKDNRAFLYAPRFSRAEFERGIAQDIISGLLGRDGENAEPLLNCIVETVSERDREMLDELERLVKEKKRELRKKE